MSMPSPIAQSSSSIRPTKKSSAAVSLAGNMSSGTTLRCGGKKDDLREWLGGAPRAAACCGAAAGGRLSKGEGTGVYPGGASGCVAAAGTVGGACW